MDEDERELREAFRVLDKGNKGTIPVEDLRWILKSIGDDFTEEELDDMIAETDTDGSGTVDYEGKIYITVYSSKIFSKKKIYNTWLIALNFNISGLVVVSYALTDCCVL